VEHAAPVLDEVFSRVTMSWGLSLADEQVAQFARYAQVLQEWNQRVNLTAITDRESIVVRHFLDSLRCALSWQRVPQTLIDVGSGAGFPGLPLKIAFPSLTLTLVEATAKKVAFLQHMVDLLALSDVHVLHARAEEVGHLSEHREQYDVVTVRAVAALRVLAEYCLPLACLGGSVLAPKGADIEQEIAAAHHALQVLGGELLPVEAVQLPARDAQSMVVLRKIARTPPQYPRRAGLPSRRPL
jgi:16S rRNA (guanine527-N7)-methyltransferase